VTDVEERISDLKACETAGVVVFPGAREADQRRARQPGRWKMNSTRSDASALDLPLERDVFARSLIRELAGTLQDVVGLEDASGYISVVGTAIGEEIDQTYKNAFAVEKLSREQVADVLVDLKKRIQGDFYILEETEDRIVFGNRTCPFGEMVRDRPSLCMMTSNVFGHIAGQNLGYAAVDLEATIAKGHSGCRVVVYLRPSESVPMSAREYYRR
jgi:predicted ArsR family transcriptional regulator